MNLMNTIKRLALLLLALLLAISMLACEKQDDPSDDTDENGGAIAYYIEYNGTEIELGKSADSVLTKLGEPISRHEIGDCGGLGAQVRYDYASFTLYVLESKTDGNIIDQITFKDDLLETPKGIAIGSSESDVRAAYGEPTGTQGDRLIYTSSNNQLTVSITDGTVTAIDLMRVTQ